jgi:hypothetical protein
VGGGDDGVPPEGPGGFEVGVAAAAAATSAAGLSDKPKGVVDTGFNTGFGVGVATGREAPLPNRASVLMTVAGPRLARSAACAAVVSAAMREACASL